MAYLMSLLVRELGRLSPRQYQLSCLALIACGATVLYCGPVKSLMYSISNISSETLADLARSRDSYRLQLAEVENRLAELSSSQMESRAPSEGPELDLLQLIDLAAQQTAVRVEGVQAEQFGTADRQGMKLRHQVVVSGGFSGIVHFIGAISEPHSPVVLIQVELKSARWSYPQQPLVSTLLTETRADRR